MATGRKRSPTYRYRTRKLLRGQAMKLRQICQGCNLTLGAVFAKSWASSCAPTPSVKKDRDRRLHRLDSCRAMLQAIDVGKGIPMLEPWIIDLIRRREEERRRGERSQLELPVPPPRWPDETDAETEYGEVPPSRPQRGVVIIGF
jgi:hypothetical protein